MSETEIALLLELTKRLTFDELCLVSAAFLCAAVKKAKR